MKEFENNTATTQDWVTASQNITLPAYAALLVSSEAQQAPEPGNPVRLPQNVAKRMSSHTEPGLPANGHEL
jgi:hypothetical protein